MSNPDRPLIEGTFEFIEAKIRRDAEGTAFGGEFEWLCKWFLESAPRYRGQFDQVWLWKDWPERWGSDEASTSLLGRGPVSFGRFRRKRIIPTERFPNAKLTRSCRSPTGRCLPIGS